MLTVDGRTRIYKNGVRFMWNVDKKTLHIRGRTFISNNLSKAKMVSLQRFITSILNNPKSKGRQHG